MPKVLYVLPTFPQARAVAWEDFRRLIRPEWLAETNATYGTMTTKTGAMLIVAGAEKPHRLEGVQYAHVFVDERSDQRDELIQRSLIPACQEYRAPIWQMGVPKRFGIGREGFRAAFKRAMTDPDGLALHWTSAETGHKSKEEMDVLRASMTEDDAQEMLGAEWLELGAGVFSLSTDNMLARPYNPDLPLTIACDFNVNPMCWLIAQVHEMPDSMPHRYEVHVIDELVLRNTDTPSTLKALAARYSHHTAGFIFLGDAASRQRRTSATQTDYDIIRSCDALDIIKVKFEASNPGIEDSVRHLNVGFRNYHGVIRVYIDPSCSKLIEDIKSAYRDPATHEVKYPKGKGHLTDALRYLAWHETDIDRRVTTGSVVLQVDESSPFQEWPGTMYPH